MSGLHRFYMGKPLSGLLYFMTMGLGGVGTLYDLLTMESQINEVNGRALPPMPGERLRMLQAAPAERARVNVPFAAPLETRLLKVAKQNGGRLTVIQAAAELGVRTKEVEDKLDQLCHDGHANVEVSEDGVLYYDFPELRFR